MILGPPGCGKTTELLDRLEAELKRGTLPARMAFVSFTQAARLEALDRVDTRFGLSRGDLPWFRTIHSAAFRLLGLTPRQVMTRGAWEEFATDSGYRLSEFDDTGEDDLAAVAEPPRRSKDDLLRYVYQWGQNRRLDVERALGRCPVIVSALAFRLFARRLGEFKTRQCLVDFSDMLERVLGAGLRPEVDVAFVDEAQDLSPLQIAVVEMWFAPCSRVYVGGDEDQAIYSFQGAEPDWLVAIAEQNPPVVLSHSYRVPSKVHAVADRIIRRNRNRVVKVYEPTTDAGTVESLPLREALKLLDGEQDSLVLVRNRMFLKQVATSLFERRVPYVVEGRGGVSPMSSTPGVQAVEAAHRIWRREVIEAQQLVAFLAQIPSRGVGLLPHGTKARAKQLQGTLTIDDLRRVLGLGALLEAMRRHGPTSVLLRMRPAHREYFQVLIDRYGGVPVPRIRLTSIHAAKGREADLVIVIPDMSRAAYLEYMNAKRGGNEAENRVAYVAVTRTRCRLVIVQPQTRRFYDYPVRSREALKA